MQSPEHHRKPPSTSMMMMTMMMSQPTLKDPTTFVHTLHLFKMGWLIIIVIIIIDVEGGLR
jgi:hypothetical protein